VGQQFELRGGRLDVAARHPAAPGGEVQLDAFDGQAVSLA
jgi:hypothetical protein